MQKQIITKVDKIHELKPSPPADCKQNSTKWQNGKRMHIIKLYSVAQRCNNAGSIKGLAQRLQSRCDLQWRSLFVLSGMAIGTD